VTARYPKTTADQTNAGSNAIKTRDIIVAVVSPCFTCGEDDAIKSLSGDNLITGLVFFLFSLLFICFVLRFAVFIVVMRVPVTRSRGSAFIFSTRSRYQLAFFRLRDKLLLKPVF
jgi:hypothetical protein